MYRTDGVPLLSTLMNGHFASLYPVGTDPRVIIERLYIGLMLAHIPPGLSETERKYGRAAYMQQRREVRRDLSRRALRGRYP